MQQLLYALVVIGGLVAYWWFTSGRHGANATKIHLGLRADEEIKVFCQGYFKLDFKASDIAMAAVGQERVGKSLSMTITQGGELVMKPQGDQPLRFRPGQLLLEPVEQDADKLVGLSGTREPADVYRATIQNGEPFKIVLARSAANQVNAWAASRQPE